MSQENPRDSRGSEEEQAKKESTRDSKTGQPEKSDSIHQDSTRPMAPVSSEQEESPPEIDEGPRPGPVDEIQEALFEAAKEDVPTDVEFDELGRPAPELDLDEGPRPGPVDEVQEAIFSAAKEGVATDVDFETLPEPGAKSPKKVVKFQQDEPPPAAPPPAEPAPTPTPQPPPAPAPQPEPDPEPPAVSDFWLLLALFITFRLLTLFLLRPGGFIRDWSDFDTYFGIASLSDYSLFPFLNFWLEWPPLVPWLSVGAYKLALLLPPWPDDPRLWFILILGSVFVLFEVGNFVLIYRLARRLFQTPQTISRVLWLYAGLFPPVYAMLGFFDGIALFFILLALELLLTDRRFLSAIAVGVGFMVKIIPIIMLPVALRWLWHKYQDDTQEARVELGLYAVGVGLTVMVLLAPFVIGPALNGGPQWWATSMRSMLGRSSWETVWAVAEGYYGFGQVEGDRLNPAETNFAVHHGWPGWVWALITLVFAGIYGYIFTRPANYTRPKKLIAFGGLTVSIFMLYNKGYSPQFLVYLLPFILLLMPNRRGVIYALVLTGLNVVEQPVYFVMLPTETWLLVFTVVVRFLVTLTLAVEFALELWPQEERLAPLAYVRKHVPVALGGFAALALVVLTPLTIRAYTVTQQANSPVSTFASFMESQVQSDQARPRLLLSDQSTYRQLYPHLHNTVDLQLASFDPTYTERAEGLKTAAAVPDLLRGFNRVWVLPTGPQARALSNAVAGPGSEVAAYNFEGLGTASLYTLRANPVPVLASARFVGGIELLSHRVEIRRNALDITLFWRARTPQNQKLTVFTHILNADGERVAGHDSIPNNGNAPVTDWAVDAVYADPHRVELPPNLPPGEYTIVAGLYNDFDERVQGTGPNGVGFANRAVPLETVRLE